MKDWKKHKSMLDCDRKVKVAVACPFLGLVALLFLWIAFLGLFEQREGSK